MGFAGSPRVTFLSISSHAESIANTQAEEEEQPDAEEGLDGRDNLKPTGQILEHARTDQVPVDTEHAERVGEAKADCLPRVASIRYSWGPIADEMCHGEKGSKEDRGH